MMRLYRFFLLLLVCFLLGACALFRPTVFKSERMFYERYAKKFGIPFDGTENKRLILAIDHWLGTPYRAGGCSKAGVDCSCFVQAVFQDVYGIMLPRSSEEMYHVVIKIDKTRLREADLVFLRGPDKKVSHVGIYMKDNYFVHATIARGVMISRLTETPYLKSFYAAGRVPGI
ncbi:MAG: NlpC/P60 family protein [Desulfobacterota bacterium]|nr:NlpC/P60 family protein [Thermodesulfobacteriota bacterium]